MKTLSLICVITGKKTYLNTEYYNAKLEKFNDEATLHKHYICSDAKKLLEKGMNVKEIRSYLKVDLNSEIDDAHLKNIKLYNNINKSSSFAPLSVFTCFETDKDVKEFLENIK